MNEAVTKRFLLYFRLMLLVWILIANAIIHVTGLEYSWLIFLSNIMMFTLEGDVKDRFVTVELGGLVGLILTVIALLSITALTPVLGGFFGFLIPLAVVCLLYTSRAQYRFLHIRFLPYLSRSRGRIFIVSLYSILDRKTI